MSADLTRRLDVAESRAAELADARADEYTQGMLKDIGRRIREVAEADAIPCWPESRDAEHREWSLVSAGPELRALLAAVYDAALELASSFEMDLEEVDLVNPWADDDVADAGGDTW